MTHPTLYGSSNVRNKKLRSIKEVAEFICKDGQYGDLLIKEKDGRLFLRTHGIYVREITDSEYAQELFEILLPMQKEVEKEGGKENMNEWERARRQAQRYKELYPPGTRLMLLSMEDPYTQIDNPTEYFKEYIARHLDEDFDREWLSSLSIYNEGRTLLNRTNASITSYGAVSYYDRPLYENVSKYPNSPLLDESFDLIEIFDQKALFSNGRIKKSELPDGVYKYDLRKGIPFFGTLEKQVIVDHAGTVLTREPIDFGDKKYIELSEETSPNFLGDEMTLGEYLSADFTEEETEEQIMEGITQ